MRKNQSPFLHLALLVIAFYPLKNYAQINCSGSSITPTTNLRSAGKSLHNMALQDQDGIGTCYANTLSLALEARIGEPVSYHQLAILYGVSHNATNNNAVVQSSGDHNIEKTILDGGFACDTFNEVKKRTPNYLCKRSSVPGENLTEPYRQALYYNALADFYDQFNKFKKAKSKPKMDIKDINKFVDKLKGLFAAEESRSREQCNQTVRESAEGNKRIDGMETHLENYCTTQYDQLVNHKNAIADLEAKIAATPSTNTARIAELTALRDTARTNFTNTKNKIAAIGKIEEDDDLDGTVNDRDRPSPGTSMMLFTCTLKENLVQRVRKNYFPKVLNQFVRDGELNTTGVFYGTLSNKGPIRELTDNFIPRIGTSFPEEIFYGSNGTMMSENRLRDVLQQDLVQAIPSLCRNKAAWDKLNETEYITKCMGINQDLAVGLTSLTQEMAHFTNGKILMNQSLDVLKKLDSGMEAFFLGAASTDCVSDAPAPHPHRISLPATLSCEDKKFPTDFLEQTDKDAILALHQKFLKDNAKKIKKDEKIKFQSPAYSQMLEKSKVKMRDKIFQELNTGKGNPVMLDFCSSFLKYPENDSSFGTNCDSAGQKHGFHAVNLIGHRCKDGKVEYLLQNSWGKGCGSYVKPAGNAPATINPNDSNRPGIPNYECDADGGNLWVPEEVLLRNTRAIQTLK